MKKPALLLLFVLTAQTFFAQSMTEVVEKTKKEFRLALQGGYGYRIAPAADGIPPLLEDYVNGLRSGYSLTLDAAYFFEPTLGLGLKYSHFGAQNTLDNLQRYDQHGYPQSGSISNDIDITFVGPSFISQYALANPAHTFFGGVSLGYLGYKDHGLAFNQSTDLTGGTFGAAFDFGYDYAISKYFIIGAQASLIGGALTKITEETAGTKISHDLGEENAENLSRLDITAGVRFRI